MPSPRKSPEGTAPALARLRRLNLIAAVFFAAQVVVLLALSKPAELPVDGAFLTGAPGMGQYGSTTLFDLRIDLVAMLAGVTNVVALLAIFGVNAAMILFGLVMERLNLDRTEVDWTPFIFGSILGALPWILIAIQFALSESEAAGVPGFVYGIFVSLFILFNGFAINMWLTYRGNGHWKDPLFAERVYIMLSFVAKTALAWQVYAGALAGY